MKIKKVSGCNVKGRTFIYELRPVNVLIGDNAKGKTAVMRCIDIGLVPKIAPASYPAIAPLFEGFPKMESKLDTDVGEFYRMFTRSGEKISLATEDRPEGVVIPPVALDADVYFGLSIEKRSAFVASMVKLPDTFSEQAVIAELKNRLKLPDDRNTEVTQSIVNDIMGTVEDSADVIRHAGVSVQEWLSTQIVSATSRQKSARDTKQRMEKSGQASVQIQLMQPGDSEPGAIAGLEHDIVRVGNELKQASESLGRVRAEKDADVGERSRRAEQRLRLTTEYNAMTDQSESILSPKKQIQDIETETGTYTSGTPNINEAISKKKIERAQFVATNQSLANEEIRLRSIIAGVDTRLCVNCQKILKGDSETQLEDTLKAMAANRGGIEEVDASLGLLESEATKSRGEDIRIQNLQKQLPQLRQTLRTAENAQQKRTQLHDQVQELSKQPDRITQAAPVRDYDKDIETLEVRIQEWNNQSAQYQERLKKATAAAQQNARKAQEDSERAKAVDDYDLQTIALDVLKEFLSKMVTAAFTVLLADANLIADAVLASPLAYKDGDLGRFDNEKRWISHRCFSGTEQAATYAAMSFALAATSPCRIVRVDELGRLDPKNKKRFIERMVQLVCDGKVDQFIGVDTVPLPYSQVEGVHVIELA